MIILFCVINCREGEGGVGIEMNFNASLNFDVDARNSCRVSLSLASGLNSMGRISLILVRNRIARLLVLCINEEHSKSSVVGIDYLPVCSLTRRKIAWNVSPKVDRGILCHTPNLTWPDYIPRIIATIVDIRI